MDAPSDGFSSLDHQERGYYCRLVVVGIKISEPETVGVVHIVIPVGEDLQSATSEKVDQARVLEIRFQNLLKLIFIRDFWFKRRNQC